MKTRIPLFVTIVAIAAVSSLTAAQRQNSRRFGNANVSIDGPVADCSDIKVTFDRTPAVTEQTEMGLPASQVSTLRTQLSTGGIFVTGWDRTEYSVKTCKAAPQDDPNATGTLRDITTNITGNAELVLSGPSDREWTANLIVMVPRLSAMNLETRNGPLSLRDLAGNIHVTATNGPVSLHNVGGFVEATTTNGPISLAGGSGDQHINATNGPISVQLSGSRWDGPGLEVSTRNGPVSLSIPDGYGSGVAVQTSDRSPISCALAECSGVTNLRGAPKLIRLGSGDPIVRVSTSNGPLSIKSGRN